jgi:cytochrome P450 family 6
MILLVLLGLVLVLLYYLNRYLLSFWSRQEVPQGNPLALFGDFKDVFLHKKSIADVIKNIYSASKHHKIFGIYLSYRPMLFINDTRLIRNIMLKDYSYFPDRGVHSNEDFDPLTEQLFFQSGQKWRQIRSRLAPAFTSGKLKAMLPIVTKNGKILIQFITQSIQKGTDVFELRDLVARLNTNIISSIAYGIEVDTVNDPMHIMRQMGVKVFEPNLVAGFRFFTSFFTPKINDIFKFKFVNDHTEHFFKSIISDNVTFREKNSYHRSDLMQTLIQLKNDGFTIGDQHSGNAKVTKISLNDVYAQSFGFYLGGEARKSFF